MAIVKQDADTREKVPGSNVFCLGALKPKLEDDKADSAIFPGPLMGDKMQKEKLERFIKSKIQECFEKRDQTEAYLFWEIMDLFCRKNGKVMMPQIGVVLFRGFELLRKKILEGKGRDKLQKMKKFLVLSEWCLPLAQLLCSSTPDSQHKESIIQMGDKFASKGLVWAAHISYVAARMELGTRSQFNLIGGKSIPFGGALNDFIMRTEVYEYVLWLTSGLGQANFQVYKLWYASRLDLFDFPDHVLKYCEVITRTIMTSPNRFKRTFFERVIRVAACNLLDMNIEEDPMWLQKLFELSKVAVADKKADADPKQQPTSPDSGVKKVQDCTGPDKISEIQSTYLKTQADLDEALAKRYTKEQLLGEGTFGSVYAGIRKDDGRKVAIKYIKNSTSEQLIIPGETRKLPTEVALMKLVCKPPQCSNVVELLEWFATPDHVILVMERPSPCMDLFEFLNSHRNLSETMTRDIMVQVVRAVQHCLDRGVLHRDIKTENLLINTETMEVKLIDFGGGDLLQNEPFDELGGTEVYVPPEVVLFEDYEGISTTIWGLGILMYYLVCEEYPFESVEEFATAHLKFKPTLSKDFIHLVLWCLDLNPDSRPSLEDLIRHEWFTEAA